MMAMTMMPMVVLKGDSGTPRPRDFLCSDRVNEKYDICSP